MLRDLIGLTKSYLARQREREERRARIEDLRRKFTTCHISEGSTITESQLGNHVSVHGGTISNSTVGSHTYLSTDCIINSATIGKFCSIGPRTEIGLWRHPTKEWVATYPAFYATNNSGCMEAFVRENLFDETPHPTSIGNDVWIGQEVLIPGGIIIGDGAIIAARSVVVKDVEPYSIVGGNPATKIKMRFSTEDIEHLLDVQWWNFSEDKLRELAQARAFESIRAFMAHTPSNAHRQST